MEGVQTDAGRTLAASPASCNEQRLLFGSFSDSEVVQIPSILLNWLKRLTPHPVSRFIQLLSDRLMMQHSNAAAAASLLPPSLAAMPNLGMLPGGGGGGLQSSSSSPRIDSAGLGGAMSNLRAIAILAATPDINAEAFTLELQHAMSVFGSSVRLTSSK